MPLGGPVVAPRASGEAAHRACPGVCHMGVVGPYDFMPFV